MKSNPLLYGALLLTTLTLSQGAMAAPFPKRGYILDKTSSGYRGLADIGRRSSRDAGRRAAMRMLSRLVRWYPRREAYSVDWETFDANGKRHHGWALFINSKTEQSIQIEDGTYGPVTKRMIRKVARHNGTFRDLTRYGAVDQVNSIEIDLGFRASYDAGSRATLRTLARRLQSPFDAVYEIRWRYRLPSGESMDITVDYNPVMENGCLDILDNEANVLASYLSVRKKSVIALGRRSGTFRDLLKWGAEE